MEKFYIDKDGSFYSGDFTEGAREATPEEINAHLNPVPTQETFTNAVQAHLDAKANERGYNNIKSAAGYAGSIDPVFNAEGVACKEWESLVWRTCYNILNEVTAGQREIPTVEELLAGLPELIWPEVE